MDAAAFDVAGLSLSAPQARFAWQAWHFEHFSGSFCVAGMALSGPSRCPRKLGDELGRMDAAVAGVTLSAPQARFEWQAWHFEHLRVDLRGRQGTLRPSSNQAYISESVFHG